MPYAAPTHTHTTPTDGAARTGDRLAVAIAFGVLAVAVLISALGGHAEIVNRTLSGGANDPGNDLVDFVAAVNAVKGPMTLAVFTVVPLGVIVGGFMVATGQRKGVQVIASSMAAGAVVVLGNGLVA